MSNKTQAQKKAQQKYMDQFTIARVRMRPDDHEKMKVHAESIGESVNSFMVRAITETMERDNIKNKCNTV